MPVTLFGRRALKTWEAKFVPTANFAFPTIPEAWKRASGFWFAAMGLKLRLLSGLLVRMLPDGQVTIQFGDVFENRDARQGLDDIEDLLNLRLQIDERGHPTALSQ